MVGRLPGLPRRNTNLGRDVPPQKNRPKSSAPAQKAEEAPTKAQTNKQRRIEAQQARERRNLELRANRKPTPWALARAKRQVRRASLQWEHPGPLADQTDEFIKKYKAEQAAKLAEKVKSERAARRRLASR